MQRRTSSPVLLCLLMLALAACASTGESRSSSSSGSATLITSEEIEAMHYSTAYAVVQALHSNWLQKKGPMSINNPTQIMVYVDGTRYGSPNSLRRISTQVIEEIRYLRPIQAGSRFGFDHHHGAILVVTR